MRRIGRDGVAGDVGAVANQAVYGGMSFIYLHSVFRGINITAVVSGWHVVIATVLAACGTVHCIIPTTFNSVCVLPLQASVRPTYGTRRVILFTHFSPIWFKSMTGLASVSAYVPTVDNDSRP